MLYVVYIVGAFLLVPHLAEWMINPIIIVFTIIFSAIGVFQSLDEQ